MLALGVGRPLPRSVIAKALTAAHAPASLGKEREELHTDLAGERPFAPSFRQPLRAGVFRSLAPTGRVNARTMPLTAEKLEELRGDAFADDVPIVFERMQHWTEQQAAAFFASGGQDEPEAVEAVKDDLVLEDEDLVEQSPAAAPPAESSDAPALVLSDDDLTVEASPSTAVPPPPAAAPALPAATAADTEPPLVLEEEDDLEDCPQPVFQTGGGDGSMIPREADKETASNAAGLEAPPGSVVTPTAAPPPASGGKDADGRPTAKAVLVGDSGVGKTSLMLRYSQDLYHANSKATVGVDLFTRDVPLPKGAGALSLQLWDTAGQEQFASLTTSYFRAAHCVVMAYDVHSPSSFASLHRWMVEVDRHAPAEVVKLVVGTKCDADCGTETAVSEADVAAFARKHGAICARCSAKDGLNVSSLFAQVAERIVRNGFDPNGRRSQRGVAGKGGTVRVAAGGRATKKKGCC